MGRRSRRRPEQRQRSFLDPRLRRADARRPISCAEPPTGFAVVAEHDELAARRRSRHHVRSRGANGERCTDRHRASRSALDPVGAYGLLVEAGDDVAAVTALAGAVSGAPWREVAAPPWRHGIAGDDGRHGIRERGGMAASGARGTYARRRPERTALYEVVRDNLETMYGGSPTARSRCGSAAPLEHPCESDPRERGRDPGSHARRQGEALSRLGAVTDGREYTRARGAIW